METSSLYDRDLCLYHSNNQNNIMKTLALVTIVMSIPTMIFSAYGMNFKDNEIPLNGEPHAFWLIVFYRLCYECFSHSFLIHKKGSKQELLCHRLI